MTPGQGWGTTVRIRCHYRRRPSPPAAAASVAGCSSVVGSSPGEAEQGGADHPTRPQSRTARVVGAENKANFTRIITAQVLIDDFFFLSRDLHTCLTDIIWHEPMYYVGTSARASEKRVPPSPISLFRPRPPVLLLLALPVPCLHHQYIIILIHKPYTVIPQPIIHPPPLPPLSSTPSTQDTRAHTLAHQIKKRAQTHSINPGHIPPTLPLVRCLPARPPVLFVSRNIKKQALQLLLTSRRHSHTHTHSSSSFSLLLVPKIIPLGRHQSQEAAFAAKKRSSDTR